VQTTCNGRNPTRPRFGMLFADRLAVDRIEPFTLKANATILTFLIELEFAGRDKLTQTALRVMDRCR
jgi:hypothetical protein